MDSFANQKVKALLMPQNFTADQDGILLDVRDYTGIAQVVMFCTEDASLGITNLLDATIHNISSDSVTTAAANLVATLPQVVAQNAGSPVVVERRISVNLDALDERYLQVKFDETNTWEGEICVFIVMSGNRSGPVNTASNKDTGGA